MKWTREQLVVTGLIAVAAALAALLAREVLAPREARAQAVSEGRADYVTAVVGPINESRVPLFLVDSKAQAIMVYEYDTGRRRFYLRVVRSFSNDRRLQDASFGEQRVDSGPSVRDVEKYIPR